jgi:hypothetical protein
VTTACNLRESTYTDSELSVESVSPVTVVVSLPTNLAHTIETERCELVYECIKEVGNVKATSKARIARCVHFNAVESYSSSNHSAPEYQLIPLHVSQFKDRTNRQMLDIPRQSCCMISNGGIWPGPDSQAGHRGRTGQRRQ